ncbi:MAG: efflux RND transporter periplasmic adaptor subunit [Verrucomicrobiota bacterium]
MAVNRGSGWIKWAAVILAAVAVVVGSIWYFRRGHEDAPAYQTVTVTRGDLMQSVTATGQLNPVTNIEVGCQISGTIQTLFVDFNSVVKAGQIIAQIDPRLYQAQVEQAEADLANANANLELQQVEARRSSNLFTNKLISESDYDTAIANLHEAEAMVKIKQASLDNAGANLGYCKIYSPVDGVVLSRSVDVGQTVAASFNTPTLFQIANDLTKMQIDANVSEADIGTVEENQNVKFTVDAFPSRTFTGQVVQIRNWPTNVQNVITYDTIITVANPDLKLRPGMTANATIITAQRSGVLKIPNASLRFRPPEPSTNQTFVAQWLAKIGLRGQTKSATTNAVPTAKAGDTNQTGVAANSEAPLTGNEPPQELFRRVREMRERGEEVPPEIRAKIRELFQSGALQMPGGGGLGDGGNAGLRANTGSQPVMRTVYLLVAGASSSTAPALQPVRVKTGVNDGTYTEIISGLKEGDAVVTGVNLQSQNSSPATSGANPFGGGGRRF